MGSAFSRLKIKRKNDEADVTETANEQLGPLLKVSDGHSKQGTSNGATGSPKTVSSSSVNESDKEALNDINVAATKSAASHVNGAVKEATSNGVNGASNLAQHCQTPDIINLMNRGASSSVEKMVPGVSEAGSKGSSSRKSMITDSGSIDIVLNMAPESDSNTRTGLTSDVKPTAYFPDGADSEQGGASSKSSTDGEGRGTAWTPAIHVDWDKDGNLIQYEGPRSTWSKPSTSNIPGQVESRSRKSGAINMGRSASVHLEVSRQSESPPSDSKVSIQASRRSSTISEERPTAWAPAIYVDVDKDGNLVQFEDPQHGRSKPRTNVPSQVLSGDALLDDYVQALFIKTIQFKEKCFWTPLKSGMSWTEHFEEIKHIFRSVYYMVKTNIPFSTMNNLMTEVHLEGIPTEDNHKVFRNYIFHIAKAIRVSLISELKDREHVGLSIDVIRKKRGPDQILVYAQCIQQNRIRQDFLSMVEARNTCVYDYLKAIHGILTKLELQQWIQTNKIVGITTDPGKKSELVVKLRSSENQNTGSPKLAAKAAQRVMEWMKKVSKKSSQSPLKEEQDLTTSQEESRNRRRSLLVPPQNQSVPEQLELANQTELLVELQYLKERFLNPIVQNNLSILDSRRWPAFGEANLLEYGNLELQELVEHFMGPLPLQVKTTIIQQWNNLKIMGRGLSMLDLLEIIEHFPLLKNFTRRVATLPITADYDHFLDGREFLIKIKDMLFEARISSNYDIINDMLTIHFNGPEVTNYDPTKAVEEWFEEQFLSGQIKFSSLFAPLPSLPEQTSALKGPQEGLLEIDLKTVERILVVQEPTNEGSVVREPTVHSSIENELMEETSDVTELITSVVRDSPEEVPDVLKHASVVRESIDQSSMEKEQMEQTSDVKQLSDQTSVAPVRDSMEQDPDVGLPKHASVVSGLKDHSSMEKEPFTSDVQELSGQTSVVRDSPEKVAHVPKHAEQDSVVQELVEQDLDEANDAVVLNVSQHDSTVHGPTDNGSPAMKHVLPGQDLLKCEDSVAQEPSVVVPSLEFLETSL